MGVPASAVSGGTEVPIGTYTFVAKLTSAKAACTGALVDPQWVVTAASCFPDSPGGGIPQAATSVLVGDANAGTGVGRSASVVKLVRRVDRDVMLTKLDVPVVDAATVAIASSPLVAGELLRVAGFGRTASTWAPDRPHTAQFTVNSVSATTAAIEGVDGVDTCKGDAGGPALRVAEATTLVAVNSTTWQRGCLKTVGTRAGSTEARVDDLADWIAQAVREPSKLVNDLSGWCLDQEYPQGADKPGTNKVGAWECNTGGNQAWAVEWVAADTARFVNRQSGLCLDQEYPQGVDGPATRQIGAWGCNGQRNQQWYVQGTPGRAVVLVNKQSGWCLDQEYPQGPQGSATHIVASWNCNGQRNQQWQVS
ncbi:trypsin-like serine protease [Actinosynnema pretiosum subsp. pretiosum]|uniref:Trypsin-like serine protease n=1 Tax=Actinosynnema pretiosum subsp. pretiosum TaxID=103721 RepID=A0AA45R4G0_9PSEU|nr:trypsin-like serine protease [Actinosynnema pretiosum subsp. pretiosum]